MHKAWPFIALLLFTLACNNGPKAPDVSKVEVQLKTIRFERELFGMDTLRMQSGVQQLVNEHPYFAQDFFFNILGSTSEDLNTDLNYFLRSYNPIAQEVQDRLGDLKKEEADLVQGLRYVKYYFPEYILPDKLITFIGPLNSYGNIITTDALAVGLQLYLGGDHPLYQSLEGQQLYPTFVSRRFDRKYMAVNCIRNIVDDMYPARYAGQPLIEQMVEAGKRAYLLDQLMPFEADTIKLGYTQAQMQGSLKSERQIWSFFVQNDLLYTIDPEIVRDYMTDGPYTAVLGSASPGFIGQFLGWRIVHQWMKKKGDGVGLSQLMATPAAQIFQQAGYKP